MPRRINPVIKSAETASTEPVTSAETVVATLSNVNPDSNAPEVTIEGSCAFTNGATATSVVVRIRRGTTASGTLVSEAQTSQIAAEKAIGLSIQGLDKPTGEQASLSYVMTVEAPAATTNPKVKGATITATY